MLAKMLQCAEQKVVKRSCIATGGTVSIHVPCSSVEKGRVCPAIYFRVFIGPLFHKKYEKIWAFL